MTAASTCPARSTPCDATLVVWDCSGAANQKFVRQAGTIRPAAATGLCLTLAGAKDPLRLQTCDGTAKQRFA